MNSNKECANKPKRKISPQEQSKILGLYYLLLTIAAMIYLFNYAMPSYWGIILYVLTISWIAFAWFYLRPIKMKCEST